MYVADAQTRIRAGDAQTTHKMVGGVTLVGGNGSELTRLPGGAELNILPANGNALHWISFVLFLLYLYHSLNTLIFSRTDLFNIRHQRANLQFQFLASYRVSIGFYKSNFLSYFFAFLVYSTTSKTKSYCYDLVMKNGARRKVAICRATRVVFVYGVALKMVYKFLFYIHYIIYYIYF